MQLYKISHSIVFKGILGILFLGYLVVFLVLMNLPQETRFLPAHLVAQQSTYFQPVEIVAVEPYQIVKDGVFVSRYQLVTPGRYSYVLVSEEGTTPVTFRIFIYNTENLEILFLASAIPLVLLAYSLKRGKT